MKTAFDYILAQIDQAYAELRAMIEDPDLLNDKGKDYQAMVERYNELVKLAFNYKILWSDARRLEKLPAPAEPELGPGVQDTVIGQYETIVTEGRSKALRRPLLVGTPLGPEYSVEE